MLGVMIPFCHSPLTGFLTPCSPVCALVHIAPSLWCLRSVPLQQRLQFFRGVPTACTVLPAKYSRVGWFYLTLLLASEQKFLIPDSDSKKKRRETIKEMVRPQVTVTLGHPCSGVSHPWAAVLHSWHR